MGDQKKIGLSFGFSKKTEVVKLKESVINEEIREREDKDYLVSLEDRKINSVKPVEEKLPLVIELIQNNRWRHAQKPEDLESSKMDEKVERRMRTIEHVQQTGDQVVDAAVSEIIADAARLNEKTLSGTVDTSLAIPLLMQNKVPDGFETDERLNVDLRPNEATGEDYEKVPIEQFGLAMLRGMGWKDGEGIGKNKKIVKPLDPVVRPKGLGLGADKSAVLQSKDKSASSTHDEAGETLVLKNGAYCQVVNGKREGQFGLVSGIDCENSRVMVSMTVDSEVISLSQFAVKLVTKKEYEKYSKYLNKSKVDRYQEDRHKDEERSSKKGESETRNQSTKHSSSSSRRDKYGEDGRGTKSSDQSDAKSKKHDGSNGHSSRHEAIDFENRSSKSDTDRKRKHQDEHSSLGVKQLQARDVWLRAHLRVRVVDKSYRKAKYYKSKVTVIDVLGGGGCVCRTEDGHVLDDLFQSQLETVIPNQSSSSTYVMIVNGKYRSQLAQLMERDRERSRAVVQLLSDRDVALTLDFNDICEYAADVAVDDFDY